MICRSFLLIFLLIFSFIVGAIQPYNVYSENAYEISSETPSEGTPVAMNLYAEDLAITPGEPLWLAIHFVPQSGWHLYWKRAGDSGFPPSVTWHLPAGFSAGEILWPYPERFEDEGLVSFGYNKEVTLLAPIYPPQTLSEISYELSADISWLACSSESCQPAQATGTLVLPSSLPLAYANEKNSSKTFSDKNLLHASLFSNARSLIATQPPSGQHISSTAYDGLLAVTIEKKIDDITFASPVGAHFFPYEGCAIDYHFSPVFTEDNSRWNFALKIQDGVEETPKRLQGELLLESESGELTAWLIDIPIAAETSAYPTLSSDIIGLKIPSQEQENFSNPLSSNIKVEQEEEINQMAFAMVLISAFLGGMLLNLMPCVLPVVSLKVLSFVKMAGQKRRLIMCHSLAFTAGVVLSFLALAALLLVLRSWGHTVGWGFQLQDPLFVGSLALLLFVLSLNMLGVMEVGMGIASWAGSQGEAAKSQRSALASSFFSGILATAVATPCTGPFLGAAVGFAVTLAPIEALTVFASVALGMSLPYVMLACFPRLLQFLPKPGPWMICLKQAMGFLLLASVLWLLWVFSAHVGSNGLIILLIALFTTSFACWILGTWDTPVKPKKGRWIARTIALAGFLISCYFLKAASSLSEEPYIDEGIAAAQVDLNTTASTPVSLPSSWEPFDPLKIEELRRRGIPVLIDFTARWCLICQANHLALIHSDVQERYKELGVVKMKADWTRHDPVITAALAEFGRNSVPLYVFYPGRSDNSDNEEPARILPQILTPAVILNYLER